MCLCPGDGDRCQRVPLGIGLETLHEVEGPWRNRALLVNAMVAVDPKPYIMLAKNQPNASRLVGSGILAFPGSERMLQRRYALLEGAQGCRVCGTRGVNRVGFWIIGNLVEPHAAALTFWRETGVKYCGRFSADTHVYCAVSASSIADVEGVWSAMHIEHAKSRFSRIAYATFLGVNIVEVARERAVLSLPFQTAHTNPGGTLNGGATASLLNLAGTLAAWTGVNLQAGPFLGSVDFAIQYQSAAINEDVVASATVRRRGRDLFFLEGTVRTAEDKPICTALMIYRAPDYADHAPRLYAKPVLIPELLPVPQADPILRFSDFVRKLEIATVHESPGRICLTMPCTAQHVDERGQMHEGALAALLDIAGTAASWTLATRQGSRGATIGMQLSYLNATQEPVMTDAYVQQRSEELFFSTVQITSVTTRQLVAMGNVSYRILEPR